MSTTAELPPHNADIDRTTPQPEIHVEERRLTLHDFLKTSVKINGSDIHLQADSIPMIRVDGRARFLDVLPLTDEAMTEYVDKILNAQAEPKDKRDILHHKGSVDVAYSMGQGQPRFQNQPVSQPGEIRDRDAADRDQDSEFRGAESPAADRADGRVSARDRAG